METLIQTKVTSDHPRIHASRGPAAFFAQKDRLMRWCVIGMCFSALCNVLMIGWVLTNRSGDMRFAVIDASGNVFVIPARIFEDASELHLQQALLATTALLLRNPSGFDLPEFLQGLFAGKAYNQAVALKAGETAEFSGKHIHQKPVVTRVEALETRPDAVRIHVSGQLKRDGVFQQQSFTEIVPFTLVLVLKHNTDLLRNRRQPTIVVDYDLKYEVDR